MHLSSCSSSKRPSYPIPRRSATKTVRPANAVEKSFPLLRPFLNLRTFRPAGFPLPLLPAKTGVDDGIRTRNDLNHNQVLYQVELHPPPVRAAFYRIPAGLQPFPLHLPRFSLRTAGMPPGMRLSPHAAAPPRGPARSVPSPFFRFSFPLPRFPLDTPHPFC